MRLIIFFIFFLFSICSAKESYNYSYYIEKYYLTQDVDSALDYLILAKNSGAPKDSIYYLFSQHFLFGGDYENALLANLNINMKSIKINRDNKEFYKLILQQRVYIYTLLDMRDQLKKTEQLEDELFKNRNLLSLSFFLSNNRTKIYYPTLNSTNNSDYNGFLYSPMLMYKRFYKMGYIYLTTDFDELLNKKVPFDSSNYRSYNMNLGNKIDLNSNNSLSLSLSYYNNDYILPKPNAIKVSGLYTYKNRFIYSFLNIGYQYSKNSEYNYTTIDSYLSTNNLIKYSNENLLFSLNFALGTQMNIGQKSSNSLVYQNIYGEFSDTSTLLSSKYKFRVIDSLGNSDTIDVIGTAFSIYDSTNSSYNIKYLPYFVNVKSQFDSIKFNFSDNYQEYKFSIPTNFIYSKFGIYLNPSYILTVYPNEYLSKYYFPKATTAFDTTNNRYVDVFFRNENGEMYYAKSWDSNENLKKFSTFYDSLLINKTEMINSFQLEGNIYYKSDNWSMGLYGYYKIPIDILNDVSFVNYIENSLYLKIYFERGFSW